MYCPNTVCLDCRTMNACCNSDHRHEWTGYKWRAPKKNNSTAWKKIEKGIWLWDTNALKRGDTFSRHAAAYRLRYEEKKRAKLNEEKSYQRRARMYARLFSSRGL